MALPLEGVGGKRHAPPAALGVEPFPARRHARQPELAGRAEELSKERPVVAVCRAGSRSAQAVAILQQKGFKDVANLTGGMLRWHAQGHPVEGGSA